MRPRLRIGDYATGRLLLSLEYTLAGWCRQGVMQRLQNAE